MESKKNICFKQAGIFVSLFCLVLLSSCNNNEKIIASVGEKELSENDAFILMKHAGLSMDSILDYQLFVNQWVENQVFIQELEKKHPEEWKLLQLKSAQFQGDFARFKVSELELNSKLDTIVSPEEVNTYYEKYKTDFILHDYIVKALYLKIPSSVDYKIDNLDQNYLLKNDKDLIEVNSYAKLYAVNYYYNDSSWIYFNELTKDIPISKFNIDNIVLNRAKTYFSDDEYTYFLNILDYKLKDEAPPIEFLQSEIKSIIVANRLNQLKEKNESKLIQRLKKNYEISIDI